MLRTALFGPWSSRKCCYLKLENTEATDTGDTKFMAYNTQGSQKPRLVLSAISTVCMQNITFIDDK